jgi:hypothetical protein
MTISHLQEITIEEEFQLREMLASNPEAIEKDFIVLKQEFPTESGPIDLLCVDNEGRLCVVELKLGQDDTMLLQALRYYDWVYANRDRIKEMFKDKNIDADKEPKIVLIARDFSETLVKSAKYIVPRIDIYGYKYLESAKTKEKGLWLNSITVEEPEAPPEPLPTVDDYINYVTEPKAKDAFQKFLSRLQKMGEGVRLNPTKYYLSVFFRGKRIAAIQTRRSFFYVYLTKASDWTDETQVEKEEDFGEIYQKIEGFFKELGGEIKT